MVYYGGVISAFIGIDHRHPPIEPSSVPKCNTQGLHIYMRQKLNIITPNNNFNDGDTPFTVTNHLVVLPLVFLETAQKFNLQKVGRGNKGYQALHEESIPLLPSFPCNTSNIYLDQSHHLYSGNLNSCGIVAYKGHIYCQV